MNTYSNDQVIWSEGQLLLPQHFQQLERHLLHLATSARGQLHAEAIGWSRLMIDHEALRRGQFALLAGTGILPDGTAFSLPSEGELPEALALTPRHAGALICMVLAIDGVAFGTPQEEPTWSTYTPATHVTGFVRYVAHEQRLADTSDPGAEPQHVALAILRPRLCLENELNLSDIALPVARVHSVGTHGEIELAADFIPPLLDLRACDALLNEINAVLDLIRHRADWQMARLNQPQTSALLETADFLLLQSLLRHEAALRFELGICPASPLEVLRLLLTLVADLGACSHPPARLDPMPSWQSMRPENRFAHVLVPLRRLLAGMRERLALEITLAPRSDGTFVSSRPLPELADGDRIVIAVHAQVPDDWFWHRFSDQAVVCASDRLVERVRLQMPGIALNHLPSAPAELPLQAGWHYFELERGGTIWAELTKARSIGLHASGQWSGLTVRGWLLQTRTGQREST